MEDSITAFTHRKVLVLNGKTPAHVAARAMADRKFGSVLVNDGAGNMVGLLTDRDLACRVVGRNLEGSVPIDEIMSAPIKGVSDQASVSDAVKMMIDEGIRRIPVFQSGPGHRCIGIVTLDDLLLADGILPKDLKALLRSQILEKEPELEPKAGQEELEKFLHDFKEELGVVLNDGDLADIALVVLGALFRRIPYVASIHMIQRVPRPLHYDLINLPPGPDRNYHLRNLLGDLQEKFRLDEAGGQQVIKACWTALGTFLDEKDRRYLLERLPKEFKDLLGYKRDLSKSFIELEALTEGYGVML